jgi:hypothetical protein
VPTSDWAPTVADVGALVRSRTTERGVTGEAGTFTANTRPTASQVDELIEKAVGRVAEKVGADLPSVLWDAAGDVAALRAAMLVELSFFGDQISQGRSPYNELRAEFRDGLDALVSAKKDLGADAAAGTDDDLSDAGLPASAYPSGWATIRAPGSETPNDARTWMEW